MPNVLLSNADALSPAGGAVCFSSTTVTPDTGPGIDCMSWGNFTGPGSLPTNAGAATGTPRAAIPNGFAANRNIGPGCSSLMQPTIDDSNDSATDFTVSAPPPPRNNNSPVTNSECVLTVSVTGSGNVTGTGIGCPGDCTQNFANGEGAMLVATPVGGATFLGWENCPSAVGNGCDEPINLSRTITANFTTAPATGGGGGGSATPSGQFTLGGVEGRTLTLNVAAAGTAEIIDAGASVSGDGAAAAAKRLLKTSTAAGGPGEIEVKLKLTKKAKRKLRLKGKVRVNAKITFTPNGGTPTSQSTRLKIKR